jgi:hypothetical protein
MGLIYLYRNYDIKFLILLSLHIVQKRSSHNCIIYDTISESMTIRGLTGICFYLMAGTEQSEETLLLCA